MRLINRTNVLKLKKLSLNGWQVPESVNTGGCAKASLNTQIVLQKAQRFTESEVNYITCGQKKTPSRARGVKGGMDMGYRALFVPFQSVAQPHGVLSSTANERGDVFHLNPI